MINPFVILIFGILIGAIITYVIMLRRNVRLQSELEITKRVQHEDTERLSRVESQFRDAFQNLAQEILEAKSATFTAENNKHLQSILNPLRERITEFQAKIDKTHTESMGQLQYIERLGLTMSEEANKLTHALKGDVKTQGNWGEVILERILEESGLRAGIEYSLQGADFDLRNEQGHKIRPDVVIKLPGERHIIVDAKVSLVAYEKYASSLDENERETSSKELVKSLRAHISGLHNRFYQHKKGVNSPDFVLLFMPLEPAYAVAVNQEPDLFQYAWEQKIVVTTPTTLMTTLWIIANIWQQEHQTTNALEIARQSGALYDKFVGFVNTLQDVGKNIERSQDSYERALKQLYSGRGNLVTRAESLRKMGAATSKELDDDLVAAGQDLAND